MPHPRQSIIGECAEVHPAIQGWCDRVNEVYARLSPYEKVVVAVVVILVISDIAKHHNLEVRV